VWPAVAKWLPTGANVALSQSIANHDRLLSPVMAALVLVGWTAALAIAAEMVMVRREI